MSDVGVPKVNLAVCGTFHYRHYVRHLDAADVLNCFYYSHKRLTDAAALGIAPVRAMNLPTKEYLTHAHLRLISHRLGNVLFPLYSDVWERSAIRRWRHCDILHLMLHGSRGLLLRHARDRGALTVGEPVNSHPAAAQELMREEYARLNLPERNVKELNNGQKRTMEEAAACDRLLVPSRFVARSYVERGFPADRIAVLPWATDLSRFSPGPRLEDGIFRVMCVAQISPRKGHVDLLDAWESLKLPNAELVFAGSMTPEMRTVLRGRDSQFTYLGAVPHEELPQLFHRADVVVLPSIEDGFSYVPLEAMACGLPVVVSENAGAAEMVEHGKTGFVVPARPRDRSPSSWIFSTASRNCGDLRVRRRRRRCGGGETGRRTPHNSFPPTAPSADSAATPRGRPPGGRPGGTRNRTSDRSTVSKIPRSTPNRLSTAIDRFRSVDVGAVIRILAVLLRREPVIRRGRRPAERFRRAREPGTPVLRRISLRPRPSQLWEARRRGAVNDTGVRHFQ